MVSIKALRRSAAEKLQENGNKSSLADVDFLLRYLLKFSKSDIVLGDKILDPAQIEIFEKALERLLEGEPVQYVVGGCEFMSLWFEVTSDTLIPRADTEILVEKVMELCGNLDEVSIFEIGSGSGCVAVSLAYYLLGARVLSVDISEGAVRVANKNARDLGVDDRCRFEICDVMRGFPVFEELPKVVVSNPPYIPKRDIESLEKKVKSFEPLTALEGGEDGLDFYRLITSQVPICEGGILAFEVGIGQAHEVSEIMRQRFCDIEIIRDLSGIERVVVGRCKQAL